MMVFLYSIGIHVYAFVVCMLAIVNGKAKRWSKGQKTVFDELQQTGLQDVIWFHCASVGEFEQGLPLVEKLKEEDASLQFLFTFFSPSGYDYVARRHPHLHIAYLPLDTASNARRFIEMVRPKAAFFIKYEFWYQHLTALRSNNIPVYLVSGIFRPGQPFFRWYGSLHRRMLACFTQLFVQDEGSVSLLHSIGVRNVVCCGDTRFDRVSALRQQPFDDAKVLDFAGHSPVFVAGSAWEEDIPILQRILGQLPTDWKVIIAPHEMDHFPADKLGRNVVSYTKYQTGDSARVLLIDQLGLLSRLYRVGRLAYIGGGYGKGIHNILEAAVYSIPVLFGPRHQKFREAAALLEEGLAFDTAEKGFDENLLRILHDGDFQRGLQERSRGFFTRNANVSGKIIALLKSASWLH